MIKPNLLPLITLTLVLGPLRATADVRTPVEPGTLERGQLGAQLGLGFGAGPPPLFGGQLVLGLGGVDLFAGAAAMPPFCIFGTCDPAYPMLGGGAQVRLYRSPDGRTSVGARASLDARADGAERLLLYGGALQIATGSERHRFVAEALVVYDDEHKPVDGFILGGRVGYELLGDHLGLTLSAGVAMDEHDRSVGPLLGAYLIYR